MRDAVLGPQCAIRRFNFARESDAIAAKRRRFELVTQGLAQTLLNQLVEIMPELREVGAWHDRGQLRSLKELGRVVDAPIKAEQILAGLPDDE